MIRERAVGEKGKFIDVLTEKLGVIEVNVKGISRITCVNTSSCQLFSYSKFCLKQNKNMFYVNCAEPVNIFYGIREDLEKLALASYFAEMISFAVGFEERDSNVLRLFLNALYYLANNKRDAKLIKCIFEMRFMSEIGLMPELMSCGSCGEYIDGDACFVIENGSLYCEECGLGMVNSRKLSFSAVKALRHIVLADFDRLFNFRVSDGLLGVISVVSEKYTAVHLDKSFKTLDFYKTVIKT